MINSMTTPSESDASTARMGWFILFALLIGGVIALAVGKFGAFTLVAVLGMLVLAVTLVNTDLALFLFLFAIYTNLSSVLIVNYGFPSTAKPLVAVMGGLIFLRYFIFKDEYRGWFVLTLLLGLYAFLGTLSLFYASNYGLASLTLIEYLKDAVIGVIIVVLAQRHGSLKVVVWAILCAGLFLATLSVFQQFTGTFGNHYWGFAQTSSNSTYGNRLSGPIGDPNYFAQIMVVLLPIALDRIWNEKNVLLKILAACAFFTILLTVIFTYSRGAFLAMLVGLFFMAILMRPFRLRAAFLGFVVLVLLFQLIPANYQQRISSLLNIFPSSRTGGYVDASVQGRTSENLVAWNIFRDHPILGVGVGNYNAYYQTYSRKLGLEWRVADRSAHNLYLEVAAERGVFGLIVFGTIIMFTLRQVFNASQKFIESGHNDFAGLATAVGISLITYLVSGIFLHDAYPRYFWVLIGICWALPQSAQYLIVQSKSRVFHQ